MRHLVHKFGVSPIIRDPITSFGLIVTDLALTTYSYQNATKQAGGRRSSGKKKERKSGPSVHDRGAEKKEHGFALEWWKAGHTGR